MRRIISCLMIIAVVAVSPAFAAPEKNQNEMMGPGPRRHLSTIVFAGIAGAILGLSTLSFYGRPQDRLSNIAVGAAVGIIGGALFTTYKAASEPKDFYGLNDLEAQGFYRRSEVAAESWSLSEISIAEGSAISSVPRAGYTFDF